MKHCNCKLVREDGLLQQYFSYNRNYHTIISDIYELGVNNNPVNDTNQFFDEQCANVLQ